MTPVIGGCRHQTPGAGHRTNVQARALPPMGRMGALPLLRAVEGKA